jgi:plasmid maintenance system antidote protein VapI
VSDVRSDEVPLGRLVDHLMTERRVEPARLAGLLGLHVRAVEAMIGSHDVVPALEADRICRVLAVPPLDEGEDANEPRVA